MPNSRKLLVIDDLLARDADEPGQPSRHSLVRSVGSGEMDIHFCTAWDEPHSRYSAEVAVDFVRKMDPTECLVLLDVIFDAGSLEGPVDLGRQLLPRLRSEFPGMPVVVMTTEKPEDDGREYLRLGAIDHLIKPLDEHRFWRTVWRYAAHDPHKWLLGHNDLYQGAVLTIAGLAEAKKHLVVQGGTAEERTAFAEFATRSARRDRLVTLDVRELTEQTLAIELFGRPVRAWDTDLTPTEGSLLADRRGAVLRLVAVEALPRSLQSSLAGFLAAQVHDSKTLMLIAESASGLARLAQEDRFDREFFDQLNGNQPVNIPPLAIRGDDLLLLLAMQSSSLTSEGLAFDRTDEALLAAEMARVPLGRLEQWQAEVINACTLRPKRALRESLQAVAFSLTFETLNGISSYSKEALEKGSATLLMDIRLRELGILVSAYKHANGNRAKAAAILKDAISGQTSTTSFDRWFQRVWKDLPQAEQDRLRKKDAALDQLFQAVSK
jgi:DNA-binding NtrC family response regulator